MQFIIISFLIYMSNYFFKCSFSIIILIFNAKMIINLLFLIVLTLVHLIIHNLTYCFNFTICFEHIFIILLMREVINNILLLYFNINNYTFLYMPINNKKELMTTGCVKNTFIHNQGEYKIIK